MAEQLAWHIGLHEAYSFRNFLIMLRNEMKMASLRLTPSGVNITEATQSQSVLFDFRMDINEVTYTYNYRDPRTDELLPLTLVGFNTSEVVKATKAVKRKDGMDIFMQAGDSTIYFRPLITGRSGNQNSVKMVTSQKLEYVEYTIPSFLRSRESPNARILPAWFASTCNQATTAKCVYLELVGYEDGVTVRHINSLKQVVSVDSYGACTPSAEGTPTAGNLDKFLSGLPSDLPRLSVAKRVRLVVSSRQENTTRVPIKTVKSLSKLNNVAVQGTMVKVYQEGSLLLVSSTVGSYAIVDIYIKDAEQ